MKNLEDLELEVKIIGEEKEDEQEGIKIDLSNPNAMSTLALLGMLINGSGKE